MATAHAIKQLEERNVASEINYMVWSDRMDLVALSNIKGEVTLHRLTWARASSLGASKEGLTVTGIAWRPDGKIIAIAYSSGLVLLIGVESKETLFSMNITGDISYISWVQEKIEERPNNGRPTNGEDEEYSKFVDNSSTFLSDPPPVSQFDASTSTEDSSCNSFLHDQTKLNLLLIGTKTGFVHIKIFGCFTCAILDMNEYINCECSIENVHINEDLTKILVTVKDAQNNIRIVIIDSKIFKTHKKEIFAMSLKYVRFLDLIKYLSNTISTIIETWESILLEMDNKLSSYASKVPEGGVTADFLELLMFGICSNEMEEFLIRDLTKKGLEKFGQTIEMSYSNIQKLLMKNITKFGQNITYHLAELRGMARLEYRYKVLGLSEESISEAILSNGAFLIKAGEMQQIINHSINNYKAFFRWLYTAIMHLMDEPIPSEIPKMTQQDLAYIAEFLQNFDHIGHKNDSNKQSGFIMERLGQYLVDSPLTIPPSMEGNDWVTFLQSNECVQNQPGIFKHNTNMSLIQQYNLLKNTLNDIFQNPRHSLATQFSKICTFKCFRNDSDMFMSSINLSKQDILYSFINPKNNVFLLQLSLNEIWAAKGATFCFPQFLSLDQESYGDNYQILDIKFYSVNILSVLLQETTPAKTGVIFQFPITNALEKLIEIDINNDFDTNILPNVNGTIFGPKLFKTIEGMIPCQFAVSGSRRVSIVLSENKRKIKLFEMEGEEEDDDDADMTYSSNMKESDISMQENSVIE